jgi:hypothetical protein
LRDGKNDAVNKVDLVTKALSSRRRTRKKKKSLLLERFVEWFKK